MFFAVWWRPHRERPSRLAARVSALLEKAGGVCFETGSAAMAAWQPARLEEDGQVATAFAMSRGGEDRPPGHPLVRLEQGTLTISAGPLPQYPLYYARAAGDEYLLACSQLQPLASLFPEASLNAERLISFMVVVEPDTEGTVYAGIRRLRPCETLVASRDGVHLTRDFPRLGSTYRRGRPDDLAAELRQRLDDAVGRAVGASKRVAVFVSGGLDSSGLLALAAARFRGVPGRAVDAISVQWAAQGDDRPYFAELMSAQDLEPVRLFPRDASPWFAQCLCADQPFMGVSTCLDLLLSATATERRADVALSGASGDIVSGGRIPHMQWARWAMSGSPLAAVRDALRFRIPGGMNPWNRLRYLVLSPFVPPVLRRVRRRLVRRPRWMTSRSGNLLARCRERAERAAGSLPDTPDAWMRELCTREEVAAQADQAGQEAALTGCFPVDVFLDYEFVRFMFEIDPVLLCHGNEFRGLYRLAMKGLLPDRLLRREDKARIEPAIGAAAVSADAIDMLRALSSFDALATRGLVDPVSLRPTLDACFAALQLGERHDEVPADEQIGQVWQLLTVEAFLRKHGRGRDLAWENQWLCASP